MRLHIRLAASIILTFISIFTIILLLPNSGVTAGLQSIALGTSINHYTGGLWKWMKGNDGYQGRDVRVVVFGDSWAVGEEEDDGILGRGDSWGWVLCKEVNCSAHLTFATSQPSAGYLDSPPEGAVTSKELYNSDATTELASPLPDLVAQMRDFLTAKSEPIFQHIIFAMSFGFWDIYHLASLEYETSQKMTDAAVDELVSQVGILYRHFTGDYYKNPASANDSSSGPPPFRIIVPKLFDPTLVPGWLKQRSMPESPSTIAEQQKQAVYLTARWNSRLENALGTWVNAKEDFVANEDDTQRKQVLPRKDVFYYDLPKYVLGLIVEHQLEDAGQKDASGLGTGDSPFTSISEPCVGEGERDEMHKGVVRARSTTCADPKTYLFWDEFNLGVLANEGIGREIAYMVKEGKRMKV